MRQAPWVPGPGGIQRDQHKALKISLAPEDQRIEAKDNMGLQSEESSAEA